MVGRVAAVGTLVAVLAGAATGADQARFAPRLRAELGRSLGSGPSLILDVSQTTTQPALARATFVVPDSQPFRLPPAGNVVGDVAVALVPAAGGPPSLLAGRLVARAANRARASGCVRKPTAAMEATLVASRGAVRKLTLRFFVHERRGTRITVCLPRQDALAGRAAVRRLAVRLVRGLGTPPDGTSAWRGLFTPAGKRGGAAAYPTTTESRGIVVSPSFLTLQGPASARRGSSLLLHGVLSLDKAAGGRHLRIGAAGVVLARAHTGTSGSYAVQVRAPKRSGSVSLLARLPSRFFRCGGRTVDAPAGCTSSTLAGVTSNALPVRLR